MALQEVLDSDATVPLEGRDEHGNTMLHVACRFACPASCAKTIGVICFEQSCDRARAELWLCSNGHMRIVKMLLRAGAAVNSENLKGQVRFEYERALRS
jgi:hypothetical protein